MRPSSSLSSSLLLFLLVPLLSFTNAHPLALNYNTNLNARNAEVDFDKSAFQGAESYKRDNNDVDFGKAGFRDTAQSYKRSELEERSIPQGGHYGTPDYNVANPFGGK